MIITRCPLSFLLWIWIITSQFHQLLQQVIQLQGSLLSKAVPGLKKAAHKKNRKLRDRKGQIKENHLHRGVGSSSLHSGHFWTLGAQVEQMRWEAGHMKIGGLALSRHIGQVRSSSFFSIASLRNLIVLLHLGQVKSSSISSMDYSRKLDLVDIHMYRQSPTSLY